MSPEELVALKDETGGIQLETLPMNILDALVASGLENSK